jgi:DNA-directed RNA polymerase specialized sigma24 family protein
VEALDEESGAKGGTMTTSTPTANSAVTRADLLRLATLLLGPHGAAEPIVEDVLTRDVHDIGRHDWGHPVTHEQWLLTLVVRACRSYLAGMEPSSAWAQAREAEHCWEDPGRWDVDPVAVRASLADPAIVDAALASLTDPDRSVVVLRDALGLAPADCECVTRSGHEITVQRLHRGRETLFEALSHAGGAQEKSAPESDGCVQTRATMLDELDGAAGPERQAFAQAHRAQCAACKEINSVVGQARSVLAAHRR